MIGHWLNRRTGRELDRQRRLEEALRAVALAITAQNFATNAHMSGMPDAVRPADVDALRRDLYLDNVRAMFTTLRTAREKVAVLVADGIPIDGYWREDEAMQANLEVVYALLRAEVAKRK